MVDVIASVTSNNNNIYLILNKLPGYQGERNVKIFKTFFEGRQALTASPKHFCSNHCFCRSQLLRPFNRKSPVFLCDCFVHFGSAGILFLNVFFDCKL